MVSKRRSETKHHDEMEPATTRKIYHLLSLVEDLLNSRGTLYEDKLVKLPAQLHASVHKLLQWGAMFILIVATLGNLAIFDKF